MNFFELQATWTFSKLLIEYGMKDLFSKSEDVVFGAIPCNIWTVFYPNANKELS